MTHAKLQRNIRYRISTCMPNPRHESSPPCSCVGRLYKLKFGAKDRSAGVNNLYVYDSDCPFFTWILMSHFPRYAFSGRRVKWNRGICTCHSQSVGRATTMAAERSGYGTKRLFYIRMRWKFFIKSRFTFNGYFAAFLPFNYNYTFWRCRVTFFILR